MIAAHPVAGVGFVNFDHVQKEYYDPSALGDLAEMDSSEFWEGGTHNSLLTPVAELGVLVGGIYLLLVGRVFLSGFRYLRSKRSRTDDQIALVTCAILVGMVFVINASLVELRYTLTPNALFWVGAAFIERASRHQRYNPLRVR
jgi:O-antigen ligase